MSGACEEVTGMSDEGRHQLEFDGDVDEPIPIELRRESVRRAMERGTSEADARIVYDLPDDVEI